MPMKTKETPLRATAPGLKKFKTEERLAEYLKNQYWGQGKSLIEIGKKCGIGNSRVRELLIKFHIRSRLPWEKASRKRR